MGTGVVTIEEVTGGKSMVRFTELPQALHGRDARWAPPVMAWERYRLDPHRNPYFERGDGVYLLARRLGQPVGRMAAHIAEPGGDGRFGFFTCAEDQDAAAALVDASRAWLADQGCTSMTGPLSFDPDDEPGVLATGFEVPGVTGRPWNPPWEPRLLADVGFEVIEERPTWRLPAFVDDDASLTPGGSGTGPTPGQAGPYADRRLVLSGVAAVPDVADALRASSFRTAWRLAKRARAGDWETCAVVRCSTEPAAGVPAIQAAAADAGYQSVIAPWSPDPDAAPETVHQIVRLTW